MWDFSAFHDVLWTTCWIATWRHSVTRLPLGGHYPLVTPYLCASPWIKFLTAACGKTGLRTEQCIVGDVVYLMRLDQRRSNKSELRLLKDSLLLAIWHSQPASQQNMQKAGYQSEWGSHVLQMTMHSSRRGKGSITDSGIKCIETFPVFLYMRNKKAGRRELNDQLTSSRIIRGIV